MTAAVSGIVVVELKRVMANCSKTMSKEKKDARKKRIDTNDENNSEEEPKEEEEKKVFAITVCEKMISSF